MPRQSVLILIDAPLTQIVALHYTTCGVLHAIAPIDGRYPRVNFVVVIDHNQVQTVDISQKLSNSLVNVICEGLTSRGALPPANLMEGATGTASPASSETVNTITSPSVGLGIRSMPEGAYITSVTAGSAAARAGLTPGMVIARVNGVALSGMGMAAAKVIDAAGSDATLTLIDGKAVKLGVAR